jgi:membrane associated rhomboid family serine protease
MYFLLVFGDNVEEWLGKKLFILLLASAAFVGDVAHIVWDPNSDVPSIGASGGISGIVTFYALTFPRARIGVLFGIFPVIRWIRVPAYSLFLVWVLMQLFGVWQQVSGFSNVSSLAHLGGISMGFMFWMLGSSRDRRT